MTPLDTNKLRAKDLANILERKNKSKDWNKNMANSNKQPKSRIVDTNKGEPMKTLPEILIEVAYGADYADWHNPTVDKKIIPEAQKAIAKELMGIIGEDEPEPNNPREESGANWNRRTARNELRATQRARLTAFIGHKEK